MTVNTQGIRVGSQTEQLILAASGGTETTPGKTTEHRTAQEPPYKVILHNDDFTPMEHVIDAIRKTVPRISFDQAVKIMLEAHKNGKAVVVKAHKELAELYQEGLTSEGLICTIEPD